MRFAKTSLAVSVSLALTACGGGGGGSGALGTSSSSLRDVPFHTPVRVDAVKPVNTASNVYDSSALFTANISTTSGQQDLILAGRQTPNGGTYDSFDMQIWSWQGGTLVNKTSQWFSGTDNRIVGTEPSIKFADFDNDGLQDMYVAPNTDTAVYGPGLVFFNNGTNFSRVELNLNDANGHDSAIYDLNNDGYLDIVTMGLRFSFGSAGRSFTNYIGRGDYPGGGSSVAIADFLGDGSSTLILTDMNNGLITNNRLYSWSMGVDGVYISHISSLPDSRFLLPKWSGYGFSGSHDIRVLAFDFDSSGRTSAVVFSRPKKADGTWPDYSEIQFNKNMGAGVFVDVTDTTLVGYDNTMPAPYNPVTMDVNSDGLIDIVLGGTNWSDNSGAQVLIHTKEHKYVASYGTVIKAFVDQAYDLEKAINTSATTGANGVVFVQGPDNQMYLATAVTFVESGVQKKAIYLSKVGNMTASAQATVDAIKQTWPWMSDGQVNAVLSQSSTTWFGLNMLDPEKALSPLGSLSVPTLNGPKAISGSVTGLKLNAASALLKVQDSIGRTYEMDFSSTRVDYANIWSKSFDDQNDDTKSLALIDGLRYDQIKGFRYGATADNTSQVFGMPDIKITENISGTWQFTGLPYSPWMAMSGSWGSVRSTANFETTVKWQQDGWTVRGGSMYTTTDIDPGLVTKVNPITAVWADVGYQQDGFSLSAGTLPKIISGSAELTLPTGVDSQGHIQYTSMSVGFDNPVMGFVRAGYRNDLNKRTRLNFSGMVSSNGDYVTKVELKTTW